MVFLDLPREFPSKRPLVISARSATCPKKGSAAWYELQGNAIHTVAQSGWRRAVFKDVAKMPTAAPAMHLGAFHPQTPVGFGAHRAFDLTPETRPSGSALELGLRLEKRKFAAGADEDAHAMFVNQRTAAGRFRILMPEHLILSGREIGRASCRERVFSSV